MAALELSAISFYHKLGKSYKGWTVNKVKKYTCANKGIGLGIVVCIGVRIVAVVHIVAGVVKVAGVGIVAGLLCWESAVEIIGILD